jgi:alanine transaminase
MKKDPASVPFKDIIPCNIGNPQSLEQQPLSFVRDVVSLFLNPSLAERAPKVFSDDTIARAKKYLKGTPNAGAYTESAGIRAVRDEVAAFLQHRDGYKADAEDIILTNGASQGVQFIMQTVIRDPLSGFKDAMLTPIPQYPLYSALTTLLQGTLVPYYLDESKGWACSVDSIANSFARAKKNGLTPRALVVINPGNPTGQVLPESNIREIVSWCKQEGILLMADEVYQQNIWKNGAQFVSFRKAAYDLKAFEGENPLQLVSFHSISKGFLGECGLRGGYFEMLGLPKDVRAEIIKLASISLCSNSVGQVATGIMVNPPKNGDSSHAQYVQERDAILASMKRRAVKLSAELNKLPGVSCQSIDGAMYAFPTITLPRKFGIYI